MTMMKMKMMRIGHLVLNMAVITDVRRKWKHRKSRDAKIPEEKPNNSTIW